MKKIALVAIIGLIPVSALAQNNLGTPTEQVLSTEVNSAMTRALQAEIRAVTLERENADLKKQLADAQKKPDKPVPVASAAPVKPAEPEKK